ncbi:MAG TPA: DUF2726 domain-containing protein [Allosphingosinicella sp.]
MLLVGFAILAKAAGGRTLPVMPRRFMSPREREALVLIEAAVPHCRVHAQVAMAALVECKKGLENKRRISVRNRFDRKIIDFVLEERSSGDVLALVALDDRTHDESKDKARDEITSAAGYCTIRLDSGMRLDRDNVRDRILAGLLPEITKEAA